MTSDELYEEADALDAAAEKLHQNALDYLDDVEHECQDMQSEARRMRAQAAELDSMKD